MKRALPLLSALALVGMLVANLDGSDWPGFRGPQSSGISTDANFPVTWTKENFLWKLAIPGPGACSPIVHGGKVFITYYTGYGQVMTAGNVLDGDRKPKNDNEEQKNLRRHLMCIDALTGKVLWNQEVAPKLPEQPWIVMIREHGYTSSTPVTDGERVYVFFGKTGVLAFDYEGKKLWHADVGSDVYLYGSAASPVLYKNLIFINASPESKALIALDKFTGKEVWRDSKITTSWASPAIVETPEGKHELILNQPKVVVAYEPETGKELWRCQGLPVPSGSSSFCTPVSRDGIVYLEGGAGPAGNPGAMAIRSGGRGDVTKTHVVWRTDKVGGSINSPIVSGDLLYIVEHQVTCLRAADGKQVYKQRLFDGTYPYPSPVLVGDKIYQMTRFDGVFVISTGKNFQVLAQNLFQHDPSSFNGSPAVSNGRMYLRSDKNLYCIGTPNSSERQ